MESYLQSLKAKEILRVEMVCLGNICRSPMAAAVLANRANEVLSPKIIVTSSGTSSWHIGEGAHELSMKTWELAGYSFTHKARQFLPERFDEVDLILAMDFNNQADILSLARDEKDVAKVAMLRSFDSGAKSGAKSGAEELEIPDPWGDELPAYQGVLAMVEASVTGLLAKLR